MDYLRGFWVCNCRAPVLRLSQKISIELPALLTTYHTRNISIIHSTFNFFCHFIVISCLKLFIRLHLYPSVTFIGTECGGEAVDLLSTITDKTHTKNISFPTEDNEAMVVLVKEAIAPIVIVEEWCLKNMRLVLRNGVTVSCFANAMLLHSKKLIGEEEISKI